MTICGKRVESVKKIGILDHKQGAVQAKHQELLCIRKGGSMQIEIKTDESCREPKVVILTEKMTEEVQDIIRRLSEDSAAILVGFREEKAWILDQTSIIRLYAAAGKVYAITQDGEYSLRLRLYELEERLDRSCFVRISNSEIINLRRVKEFDLSFTGTIRVTMENQTATYVSRRYVAKIKRVLGL